MTQEGKTLPLQGCYNSPDLIHKVFLAIRDTKVVMGREPMSPEIHGNIMEVFWKKRDESVKGVGIVQPAVQAKNWGALLGAPGFGSDVTPGHSQLQF